MTAGVHAPPPPRAAASESPAAGVYDLRACVPAVRASGVRLSAGRTPRGGWQALAHACLALPPRAGPGRVGQLRPSAFYKACAVRRLARVASDSKNRISAKGLHDFNFRKNYKSNIWQWD